MKQKECAAIIVAAGSASRMGGIDKTVAPVAGVPLIQRTLRALAQSEYITRIVVVTRQDLIEPVLELCKDEEKLQAVIPGGASRAESVRCGLEAVDYPWVAIHDGARPLVTAEVIQAAVEGAWEHRAAAPAVAVKDTIKAAKEGIVYDTPDRSTLFAVQTPQVFDRLTIYEALCNALEQGLPLTDDCSAAEAAGLRVVLTQGSDENIKITTPIDLVLAEAILKRREDSENRTRI